MVSIAQEFSRFITDDLTANSFLITIVPRLRHIADICHSREGYNND